MMAASSYAFSGFLRYCSLGPRWSARADHQMSLARPPPTLSATLLDYLGERFPLSLAGMNKGVFSSR